MISRVSLGHPISCLCMAHLLHIYVCLLYPAASSPSMAFGLFLFCLLAKASSSERKDFVNEIDMMKKVAKGNNPHVVSLIGCVTLKEPLCLIIEYLKYGDLLSYLHGIKQEVSGTVLQL